jgi:hypothetical protein
LLTNYLLDMHKNDLSVQGKNLQKILRSELIIFSTRPILFTAITVCNTGDFFTMHPLYYLSFFTENLS